MDYPRLPDFREALHEDICPECGERRPVIEFASSTDSQVRLWCERCSMRVFGWTLNQLWAFRVWHAAYERQMYDDWLARFASGEFRGDYADFRRRFEYQYPWDFREPPPEPLGEAT